MWAYSIEDGANSCVNFKCGDDLEVRRQLLWHNGRQRAFVEAEGRRRLGASNYYVDDEGVNRSYADLIMTEGEWDEFMGVNATIMGSFLNGSSTVSMNTVTASEDGETFDNTSTVAAAAAASLNEANSDGDLGCDYLQQLEGADADCTNTTNFFTNIEVEVTVVRVVEEDVEESTPSPTGAPTTIGFANLYYQACEAKDYHFGMRFDLLYCNIESPDYNAYIDENGQLKAWTEAHEGGSTGSVYVTHDDEVGETESLTGTFGEEVDA